MAKKGFGSKMFVTAILSLTVLLGGCTPIEDQIVNNYVFDSSKSTLGSLTVLEWTNEVNRMLLPLLSEGEAYLAHHLDIVKGKFPIKEEIAMVDSTLDKVQRTIEKIEGLYQPRECTEQKVNAITRLRAYKDALKKYRAALEKGDKEAIKQAADLLKNEFGALKTVFQVYQH